MKKLIKSFLIFFKPLQRGGFTMERIVKMLIVMSLSAQVWGVPLIIVGPNETYTDIQSGINAASSGWYVKVKAGTYTIQVPINFNGKNINLFSESGAANTIIEMGTPTDADDACVVKFVNSESNLAKLEGFTITGGTGVEVGAELYGGGIYIDDADPKIKDCIITGNSVDDIGSGIYAEDTSSTFRIEGCRIVENTGDFAVHIENGAGTMTDCIVGDDDSDLVYTQSGGVSLLNMSGFTIEDSTILENISSGITIEESSGVEITDTLITENTRSTHGGGIWCSGSSPSITRCVISLNKIVNSSKSLNGAGIYCQAGSSNDSSPTITDCIIESNLITNDGNGGGLYCEAGCSPTLTNCLIVTNRIGNRNEGEGGGIYCQDHASPTLINCTIADNEADLSTEEGTDEIFWYNSNDNSVLTIMNCIISNKDSDAVLYSFNSNNHKDPIITYTFIPGWNYGVNTHNIYDVDDPKFVGIGDYHLNENSPCINKGTDTGAPSNDLDGIIRNCGTTDMGAYEFCEITEFERGDVNQDGSVDLADVIVIGSYIAGTQEIDCVDAADVNDDGEVNGSDSTYLFNYIYYAGPDPASPFGSCDTDPNGDALTCESFSQCN